MTTRRYDYPQGIKLVGGFNAVLTCDETNQWHEFVSSTKEYKRLIELQIMEKALDADAKSGIKTDPKVEDILREQQIQKEKLYEIGKRWYDDLKGEPDDEEKA